MGRFRKVSATGLYVLFYICCFSFMVNNIANAQNDTIKIFSVNGAITIRNDAPDSIKTQLAFMIDNNAHILMMHRTLNAIPYINEAVNSYYKVPLHGPMGWRWGNVGSGSLKLKFNKHTITEHTFWVTPPSEMESLKEIDGLIGTHIFKDNTVLFDFKDKFMVVIGENERWNPLAAGFKSLPVKFHKRKGIVSISLPITINGEKQSLKIDLGCSSPILLKRNAYARSADESSVDTMMTFHSVAGLKDKKISMMDSALVEIEGNTPCYLRVLGISMKTSEDGLLGMGYLTRFTAIILDYRNQAVYFKEKAK